MLLSLWNPARIVARGRYACNRFLPCLGILAILAAELLPGLGWAEPANADQPALIVVTRAGEQHFTAAELLARADSAVVNVSGDIYDHAVSYRAVPLLALLGSTAGDGSDTVEAQASDGFVSQIPMQLIAQGANGGANGGAVAWLAVEDPAHLWPRLAQETGSAGPFYLIWEHPERSGVSREQWPYKLVRLSLVESSDHRWPQLAVPANASNDASVKRGHDVFLEQCFPCHRLRGGGASDVGPDLALPISPTQYLTEAGLRALIRDPRAVRTWPGQRMVGFSESALPDSDLDALIAYLRAKADNKADNTLPGAPRHN